LRFTIHNILERFEGNITNNSTLLNILRKFQNGCIEQDKKIANGEFLLKKKKFSKLISSSYYKLNPK